jgi:hypothetical protein
MDGHTSSVLRSAHSHCFHDRIEVTLLYDVHAYGLYSLTNSIQKVLNSREMNLFL